MSGSLMLGITWQTWLDLCGGHAVSDFQVTNSGQTYLTVRVPLHVSYLYATAPIGWGSLEHRTEMEFSFYYDTVLWKTGLETGGQLGGKLQVMRILIGDNGKLVIDFKTHAKFRGEMLHHNYCISWFRVCVFFFLTNIYNYEIERIKYRKNKYHTFGRMNVLMKIW